MNLNAIWPKKMSPKFVPLTDSSDDSNGDSERSIAKEEEIESSINLPDISSDDAEWISSSDWELDSRQDSANMIKDKNNFIFMFVLKSSNSGSKFTCK